MANSSDSGDGWYVIIKGNIYDASNITDIYYNGTIINKKDCTIDTCSLTIANFEYLPNLAGNYFFIIIFALLLLISVPLGIYRKTWGVAVGMFFGLVLEAVGYGGRIMAHANPFAFNPFLIYLICLTIAPAFLSAAIYLCGARIMVVYGISNARFKPRTYSLVFMFSDFVALVLQGAGGGIAATASGDSNQNKAQSGINIMIAGLAWQVVSLLIFAISCADFSIRVRKGKGLANPAFLDLRESAKWKGFLWALGVAVLAIFIRSVYRVAELAQGFSGEIAQKEIPYMIFEGAMITIAALAQTAFHPGLIFGTRWQEADYRNNDTAPLAGRDVEMKGGWESLRAMDSSAVSQERVLMPAKR